MDNSHSLLSRTTQDDNLHSSVSPVQSQSSAPHLNPRSCVTCRKRKVRCDKVEPSCGNCAKAHIDCIFPAPGRAPRKARKPPDAELLKRLKRLEGVVQRFGAHVDDDELARQLSPPQSLSRNTSVVQEIPIEVATRAEGDELPLGKLVVSEGKSRYVNNTYWAGIGNELSDIRDILDQSDSEEEDHLSPDQNDYQSPAQQGFIFGFSSTSVDMRTLTPSPSQIFIIWEIFKENIDPVVKVLHCPSVKNLIMKAAVDMDKLSRPAEALFFSICFGTVVSMTEDQCQTLLGDNKMTLWKKYRFATEQALARADFLNSSSLMVLQAFVFYLICVRFYDDSKSIWALGGLAIQLAYTQGLHRDGTHFGLDPFEVEMRRRLWWHIAILDIRAAEDHGTEIRTSPSMYDTKFPKNINDEDIWPGMKTPVMDRAGPTEMTMCLIRIELSSMVRQLNLYAPESATISDEAVMAKEKLIDECHQKLEEKYVHGCNMNIPIQWVAATVSRLILAKMWLKLHHPRLARMTHNDNPELRDRVFVTSIEVIEFGHLLESNEKTARWGWLFRTYMQWHSMAYVLSELCVRSPSSEVDRAWRAVESVYEDSEHGKKQRGMLWKPIRHLMAKARAHQARTANNGVKPKPNVNNADDSSNLWLTKSAIGETADALGLDFNDAAMMDEMPGLTTTQEIGLDFSDPTLMSDISNFSTIQPGAMRNVQASTTPDIFSWDGWSPGVGGFSVGAQHHAQPLTAAYTEPQEWF